MMLLLVLAFVFVAGMLFNSLLRYIYVHRNSFKGRLVLFLFISFLLFMIGFVFYLDASIVSYELPMPGGLTPVLYEPEQINPTLSSKLAAKIGDKAFVMAVFNIFAWAYVAYLTRQL